MEFIELTLYIFYFTIFPSALQLSFLLFLSLEQQPFDVIRQKLSKHSNTAVTRPFSSLEPKAVRKLSRETRPESHAVSKQQNNSQNLQDLKNSKTHLQNSYSKTQAANKQLHNSVRPTKESCLKHNFSVWSERVAGLLPLRECTALNRWFGVKLEAPLGPRVTQWSPCTANEAMRLYFLALTRRDRAVTSVHALTNRPALISILGEVLIKTCEAL